MSSQSSTSFWSLSVALLIWARSCSLSGLIGAAFCKPLLARAADFSPSAHVEQIVRKLSGSSTPLSASGLMNRIKRDICL